jgi:hypothetical protein
VTVADAKSVPTPDRAAYSDGSLERQDERTVATRPAAAANLRIGPCEPPALARVRNATTHELPAAVPLRLSFDRDADPRVVHLTITSILFGSGQIELPDPHDKIILFR